MKKFLTVYWYELKEFLQSKGFVITTLIIAILGSATLFILPRVFNVADKAESGFEDFSSDGLKYVLYDPQQLVGTELAKQVSGAEFIDAADETALKDAVSDESADAGFYVKSEREFEVFTLNSSMFGDESSMFSGIMTAAVRARYCSENSLDPTEFSQAVSPDIMYTETTLGKDAASSYWYCYMLVIVVFMLIVLYGQMIATGVASEKSNRAIEVLITSTSPNSLLFGKVLAGATAGVLQSGVIIGSVLASYSINRELWGGMLDMFLAIPPKIVVIFALFGTFGYLFYAFLFGAMGALVSKIEDISRSVSGLMIIIMFVYFFSLFQLFDADGIAIKVLSFLPISSYTTMFARAAMGSVAAWEIVLSFVILLASTVGTGMLGAALYRMGTLRYGNPIKLTHALKTVMKRRD